MVVRVTVDRPLNNRHPKYPDMIYPINYGYIRDMIAGDGEEQDVCILGVDVPLEEFEGEVIAVIHRKNDCEDKWVVAPAGMRFTKEEIIAATHFQERYFDIEAELIKEI